MQIEFLGHAGFLVRAAGYQILVDPWLTASTAEDPVLNSIATSHRTIDYLIPEPRHSKEEIDPDVILISHYHTHHAPKADIEFWLSRSKKAISLIAFELEGPDRVAFEADFTSKYPRHKLCFVRDDVDFNFGKVLIKVMKQTSIYHLAFYIQLNNCSFLHIADSIANRAFHDRRLDPLWHKFKGLKPTMLTLTVGTTSMRCVDKNGEALILENMSLSPVEAANVVKAIEPKIAGVMGVFNFSLFKNRIEFAFSPLENEAYFRWAVHHLTPAVDVATLRPGVVFDLQPDGSHRMFLSPVRNPY